MHKTSCLVIAVLLLASLLAPSSVSADWAGPRFPIVKFDGVVEDLPENGPLGTWMIAGEAVQVTGHTILIEAQGVATIGVEVMVVAKQLAEGGLEAIVIRVKPSVPADRVFHIAGQVTELGDDYLVVHHLRVALTEETEVEGTLAVGVWVTIRARWTSSGFVALSVVVRPFGESVVEWVGTLERMDEGVWIIGGREVIVTDETVIEGVPEVGDLLKVCARVLEDERLLALRIRVLTDEPCVPERVTIEGTIDRLPRMWVGEWIIGGQWVIVTPRTRLEGTPAVGSWATIEAVRRCDGTLHALAISVEGTEAAPVTFSGAIRSFPRTLIGPWHIGDRRVLVTVDTAIEGTPRVGAMAQVTAQEGPYGVLVALAISIEASTADAPPESRTTPEPARPAHQASESASLRAQAGVSRSAASGVPGRGR